MFTSLKGAPPGAPHRENQVDITVIWQGRDGEPEAHAAGCADIARLAKRGMNNSENFTAASYRELVERMAASNVGSLEDALAEVGDYEGLWHPTVLPCAKRLPAEGGDTITDKAATAATTTAPGETVMDSTNITCRECPATMSGYGTLLLHLTQKHAKSDKEAKSEVKKAKDRAYQAAKRTAQHGPDDERQARNRAAELAQGLPAPKSSAKATEPTAKAEKPAPVTTKAQALAAHVVEHSAAGMTVRAMLASKGIDPKAHSMKVAGSTDAGIELVCTCGGWSQTVAKRPQGYKGHDAHLLSLVA